MQLRLPPVPVRWAIGLLIFIGVFAWYTAPNPLQIEDGGDPFVGRWLVNGSSKGIAVMHIEPTAKGRVLGVPVKLRELALSLENPEGFNNALGMQPVD